MILSSGSPHPKLLAMKVADRSYLEWVIKEYAREVQILARRIVPGSNNPKNARRLARSLYLRQRCIPYAYKLLGELAENKAKVATVIQAQPRPLCVNGHGVPAFSSDGTCVICLALGWTASRSQVH